MKNKLFLIFILLVSTSYGIYCQSYLGHTTQEAKLRSRPGFEHPVIKVLPANSSIFIISLKTENNYYHTIDIEDNSEGYIYKDLVVIDDLVPKNTEDIFSPTGHNTSYNPIVTIKNSTDLILTLKFNDVGYTFDPLEEKSITISPGNYDYLASAPSVIPEYGSEKFESNTIYTWEFYIVKGYK